MSWDSFFSGLRQFLMAVLIFFGRLLRDIWLEVWRPVRRQIVKWAPLGIGCLLLLWMFGTNPQGTEAIISLILVIGIMLYGLKVILFGFKSKTKK